MAKDELKALLESLQGAGAGRILSPGLLAQLPSFAESVTATGTRQAAGSESRGATIAKSTLQTAGGGLTLLPVVSGLLKLFGVGGKKEEPPPLEKFTLPPSIRAEAGLSASGETILIDRGVGDRIRQLPAQSSPLASSLGAKPPVAGTGASITVNVQAMDSQSFLDRREDIARAVREAMLQSHSLNDVVSEL
ncbi:MAG: hypothetical protein HYX27_08880 [Acidobacteria bacterium]|nr:hypothetical protein [Acidobacteriota bacterium]